MCGILGIASSTESRPYERWRDSLRTLAHRGPDDSGTWVDDSCGIILAHARLSILDLSPLGHQPMVSQSGRFILTFNGEIYNFRDLKTELEQRNCVFKGSSDTEVMLAAFEAWGVEKTLKNLIGMFAIGLWDRTERKLYLSRDRLGEKPLYYGWSGGCFLFASELKALRAHPAFCAEVNRDSLSLFMRYSYIPAPYSIYAGIHKLPPATFLELPLSELHSFSGRCSPHTDDPATQYKPKPYWSAKEVCQRSLKDSFKGSDAEALAELDQLLRKVIKGQMISDVPLGAFLSGGIDSSTVVALMQAESAVPIKTFSIGFHERHFNEAQYAKDVAFHLGTDHTELYVTAKDALGVIPLLHNMYDEPFADSSQIPTYLVSKIARQKVTVALSGDGGDEVFCGYPRFIWANKIWSSVGWMPHFALLPLIYGIHSLGPHEWDRIIYSLPGFLPRSFSFKNPGHKLYRLATVLSAHSREELYRELISVWDDRSPVVLGAKTVKTALTDSLSWIRTTSFVEWMMYLDLVSYLPDDILAKVDRAAMAVSLETRAPFLDHRVVEFAWRLPLRMKYRHGFTKYLLRKLLHKYVPVKLVERPKMGFGVPIDFWLRVPLRDWAEGLLNEARLREEGYLNPAAVRNCWGEHLSGRRNWTTHLWNVLMFQAWLEEAGS
jgi:asparagine synthase (glutamine-hydrolysing)